MRRHEPTTCRSGRWLGRRTLAVVVMALVSATACSGSGSSTSPDGSGVGSDSDPGTDSETGTDPVPVPVPATATATATADASGGGAVADPAMTTVTLGAQGWPTCLNPLTPCGGTEWLIWTVTTHVAARAMELDADGDMVASPLLRTAPSVTNGGLDTTGGGFVLTYELDRNAVWSDGTPITCGDFEFTWRAHLDTPGATTTGYELVSNVDCSDAHRPRIVFGRPYGPWAELFGGAHDQLLPAHAFDTTDISDAWQDHVPVSGGPWILEEWSATGAVLRPNERYWDPDRLPGIDRVAIVPNLSAPTQARMLDVGELDAAYPDTAGALDDVIASGRVDVAVAGTGTVEGLWPNQQGPDSGAVLADVNVREALLRTLDRDALASVALGRETDALDCAGWVPNVGAWCDPTDFGTVAVDPDAAATLLDAAGWTLPRDGRCRIRDGRELRIDLEIPSDDAERAAVADRLVEMTASAGICWTIVMDSAVSFANRVPALDVDFGVFAIRVGWDPSTAQLYGPPPSPENSFAGRNFSGCVDPACAELADIAADADREVDPRRRLELVREVGDRARQLVLWLPLHQHTRVTAWRSDVFAEPVGAFTGLPYGGFADMYAWRLSSP